MQACRKHTDHRALVTREPFRGSDLIVPREAALCVGGELDVVGRVGIHEVSAGEPEGLEIGVDEFPVPEGFLVRGEVVGV